MKSAKLFLVLILFSLINGTIYCQTGWIQTEINSTGGITIYPSDTEIYAVTSSGIFSTTDNGMPWILKTQALNHPYDLIKSSHYLIAACVNGIFRSSDEGNSWQPSNGLTSSYISVINTPRLFAKNSSYIFVMAGTNNGIFRSSDDGANWEFVPVGPVKDNPSKDLGMGATSIYAVGEKIFLGVSPADSIIAYTSDNGKTWNFSGSHICYLSNPSNYEYPGSISSFHFNNGKLFAAGDMGIYLSQDTGKTWTPCYRNSLDENWHLVGLGPFLDVVSYQGKLIAAVGAASIRISKDDGYSWNDFNEGISPDWYFLSLAIKSPYIWGIRNVLGNVYRRPLNEIVTEIESNINNFPQSYCLYQNYPNPFNPTTKIKYSIPNSEKVIIKIYDVLGREVETLLNEYENTGRHEIEFDASNLASGLYFYKITSGNYSETKKMILLR